MRDVTPPDRGLPGGVAGAPATDRSVPPTGRPQSGMGAAPFRAGQPTSGPMQEPVRTAGPMRTETPTGRPMQGFAGPSTGNGHGTGAVAGRGRPGETGPFGGAGSTASPDPFGTLRESWSLGDLLARASREDDDDIDAAREEAGHQPPPVAAGRATPQEAPTSAAHQEPISLDTMAQAIDSDTAAVVWSRYRNGERGLFSRDIYTRQGQTTFDEISRRIRTDAGFREMSERYLADFERLLRDSEQKDPSGMLVQNHLVAATGRVYLLLAHASGRLA
ncbi:MAG: hypothetical protein R3D33_14760 [Hyphomicrobiaceae bacterium]